MALSRTANAVSDLLAYKTFVADDVILLRDGALMSAYRLYGADLDAATVEQRENVALAVNTAIKRLADDNLCFYLVTMRVRTSAYPPQTHFSELVTTLIDEERRLFFHRTGNGYETMQFLFFCRQPMLVEKAKKIKIFKSKNDRKAEKRAAEARKELVSIEKLEDFRLEAKGFANSLSSAFAVEPLVRDDFYNVLNAVIQGKTPSNAPMPDLSPSTDLGYHMAKDYAPSAGIQLYDNRYVSVLSVDQIPTESWANMYIELARMPFEYTWTIRYIGMSYLTAHKKMIEMHDKNLQASRPLLDQIMRRPSTRQNLEAAARAVDAEQAMAELDSGDVSEGYFTGTITIRSDEQMEGKFALAQVQRNTNTVHEVVTQHLSSGCRIEEQNAPEAFIGSWPGHGHENCRKLTINSHNAAHLIPLGASWSGPAHDPCPFKGFNGAPCIMQVGTYDRNPFRLPLHYGDVGHTLIIGPTGAGKSTLLATLAAQFDRYENSQIFIFDKGRSLYPLVQAMENSVFYDLGSEESPPLCPLANIDTKEERAHASEFLQACLAFSNQTLTPAQTRMLDQTLQVLAENTKNSQDRTISSVYIDLQDDDLKNALFQYTREGPYGHYLDGDENTLRYANVTAFELEKLMELGDAVVTPTLTYLFHEIERRCREDRPSMIIVDECWTALSNPTFAHRLNRWLLEMRKKNTSVVLATQNVVQVLNSTIADSIFQSCPTRILLPNPQIEAPETKKKYMDHLSLNEMEISILAKARPKRDYYYTSPAGRRLFSLELESAALAFVGSAGKEDLAEIEKLIKEHGKEWPVYWLDVKEPDAAKYWRNVLVPEFQNKKLNQETKDPTEKKSLWVM